MKATIVNTDHKLAGVLGYLFYPEEEDGVDTEFLFEKELDDDTAFPVERADIFPGHLKINGKNDPEQLRAFILKLRNLGESSWRRKLSAIISGYDWHVDHETVISIQVEK